MVSHLPYHDLRQWDESGYEPIYERTIGLAMKAMENTSVKTFVTLGPYPVDLINLEEKVGLEKAEHIMMEGMELASKYVIEEKAIALGEIGRPHFDVSDEIWSASNRIMKRGMELAADIGCPVVLHTESATPEVCKELAEIADDARLSRTKVIKHYSPPIVEEDKNHGLFPSVLASTKNIESALKQGTRFMMETDYLDDPNRPGAVLGIKTVPRRTKQMLEDGLMTEEDVYIIHKENPEKVYSIEM